MTVQPGPMYGERLTPAKADALLNAFPGVAIYADLVSAGLAAAGIGCDDPDADMVTPATAAHTSEARGRLPGIRDPLHEHHPVAIALRIALDRSPDAIPEPDERIVSILEAVGCVRAGRIVTYEGVPIPAGIRQTAYHVVLRYRALFSPVADPARIYRDDLAYDASVVTDEMQESILLVSTRIHRDNLIELQQTCPELFVAIWMRETAHAERLVADIPADQLPPCYPRTVLDNPRECLMIVCDVMDEHERAFDLLNALKFYGGVTRASVKATLQGCTSMTAVRMVANGTRRHVASGVAHARSMHPTMNVKVARPGADIIFQETKNAFEQSRVYGKQYRHVAWVAGAMPTRFFLGLEPAMLIPVHLLQMRETMARHEGKFWLGARGKQDLCNGPIQTRLMSHAIIITSNICLPTARAMMHDDGLVLDSIFLHQNVVPLVRNPKMQDELAKNAKRSDDKTMHAPATTKVTVVHHTPEDGARFKNGYKWAQYRATRCSPKVGEFGWTQGFRFDAWRQPRAEIAFLRNCCRYILYDPKQAALRDRWTRPLQRSGKRGKEGDPLTAADVHTGLPRQHLVECVQDLWRDQFDRLQVAELTKGADKTEPARRREAYIVELAAVLPALTAITDDPALNERFWIDRHSPAVRFAVQASWNT